MKSVCGGGLQRVPSTLTHTARYSGQVPGRSAPCGCMKSALHTGCMRVSRRQHQQQRFDGRHRARSTRDMATWHLQPRTHIRLGSSPAWARHQAVQAWITRSHARFVSLGPCSVAGSRSRSRHKLRSSGHVYPVTSKGQDDPQQTSQVVTKILKNGSKMVPTWVWDGVRSR